MITTSIEENKADIKHPLEATKSWMLHLQRRRRRQQQQSSGNYHRSLKKKRDVDDEFEHTEDNQNPEIEITHTSQNHKIPKAEGSSMHGMMIDAGSVSLIQS
jgi:hypothetical protein